MVAVLDVVEIMKFPIHFTSIAIACSVVACHPQETSSPADSRPEMTENTDEAVVTATPSQDTQDVEVKMPAVDTNWNFLYRERRTPELFERYRQALKLIVDETGIKGTVETTSRRLGDWFVIGVDDGIREDPETIPLDAPAIDHVHTYVVDMANQKVIQTNDFAALRPLFDALDLAHRQPFESVEDEKKFLGSLAVLIASVANNRWRYIEPISGQRFPPGVGGPMLEIEGNTVTFTYFVSGSGMMMSFTRNQLVVSPKGIVFNAEIYRSPKE